MLTHRNLTGIQPYYAAWLALTGGGSNASYIAWIGRMWRTFAARHGLKTDYERRAAADQFGAWLNDISGLGVAVAGE